MKQENQDNETLTRTDLALYERQLNLRQIDQMRAELTEAYRHLHDQIILYEQEHEKEIKKSQFRKQFMELCTELGIDPLTDGGMIKIKRYFQQLAVRVLNTFTEFELIEQVAARLRCDISDVERSINIIKDISDIKVKQLEDGTKVLCRRESAGVQNLARLVRGRSDWNRAYKLEELLKNGLTDEQVSALLSIGNLAIDSEGPGCWFDPDYWIVM